MNRSRRLALTLGGLALPALWVLALPAAAKDGKADDHLQWRAAYAVDVSAWPRCDAESSPERGYYYHPSRYSAGQPIVAGWAYQLIARLGFVRDS